jgi:hypothetical protein
VVTIRRPGGAAAGSVVVATYVFRMLPAVYPPMRKYLSWTELAFAMRMFAAPRRGARPDVTDPKADATTVKIS